MSVGYLLHAFDLINVSDLDLIRQAQGACTELVVGVLRDRDVVAVSGRSPVVPEHERVALVAQLRGVDRTFLHTDESIPTDAQVFASPGTAAALGLASVALVATTETASVLLREALRPARSEVA